MHSRSLAEDSKSDGSFLRYPPLSAGLTKKVLANGLTVILREDHSAPVTAVQVWAKTGSIHETTHLGAGLSHILEHMLFKGTEKRGVAEISQQVEACGGSINAYTTWERTVYHIDIPSEGGRPGTSHGTEMAIDILADAMMHSTLPPDEYLREQQVILRELAMNRDSPDRQASELLFSTAYAQHPSRLPVIGYEEVYRGLKREDAMAYYKERYVPNNLIFVVVGDMDSQKVLAQITKLMGDWKRQSLAPVYIPDEPVQISERDATEESRTTARQARIHLGYQTCDFRSPDAAPLEVLSIIAGSGMSSRLFQELREKKQLVHTIDAWSHTPPWRGIFGVSAVAEPDKIGAARDAMIAELEKFKNAPPSETELAKARKMALSGHLSALETMGGQAGQLASDELHAGDLNFSEKYLAQLQKVTPQDVQRVAMEYFRPDHLTVAILEPKGSLKKTETLPEKNLDQPVHKEKLANGLTLLTKEDHRLPFVELRLVMTSGLLFENEKNNGVSELTSKLLLKGTKTRSAEKIVNDIESVGGQISTYSGINSMGLSIRVMQPDLPLALEVLSDILKDSKFDDEEISHEKTAQIAEIHQEREAPVKVALLNARLKLFGAHPYGMPNLGTEKKVEDLKREEILAFWKRVSVPSNMVLSVFGDIPSDKTPGMVKDRLGSLKGETVSPGKFPSQNFGKDDRVTENQDKEQGVIVIAYPGIDLKNPDRPNIELMNAALSGMGSRLFLRLRDQLALCYYVGVNEMVGVEPGFIYFYIGTEPGKVSQAEQEIRAEIEKLRKEGLSVEELDRARNGLIGEHKMHKQNLGDLAMTSALDELYGLGYDYSEKLVAAYGTVTPAQVQSAARKYLGQPSITSIVMPK